jgi:anti-sigma regulatory factor (Ser/Thr protein kinase)
MAVVKSTTAAVNPITKLDSISFDQFLEREAPFRGDTPTCDLRAVRLITPAVLVQIAAGCHALAQQGRTLLVRIEDESVRGYLMRCGFFGVIASVATIDPPAPNTTFLFDVLRGSNPMLIEVTRIENGAALPALLDQIVWVLRHRLKYKKFDAFDVATAISEACQNTFDHNADTCGFIAMQVYGRGRKRFLEIGISDYGDGLAPTLRKNPKNTVPTDLAAIRLATQLGTSEHDDPTRGTGLYHLLEITYKHQGSVQIKSGAAKVRYRMDKRLGWSFSVPSTAGVHLALTLPSKAASRTAA